MDSKKSIKTNRNQWSWYSAEYIKYMICFVLMELSWRGSLQFCQSCQSNLACLCCLITTRGNLGRKQLSQEKYLNRTIKSLINICARSCFIYNWASKKLIKLYVLSNTENLGTTNNHHGYMARWGENAEDFYLLV